MKVRLENVHVAYSGSKKPAIRNVSLKLKRGIYAITGPNGAGKTTLLETILGLLRPFKGEAYLLGVNTKSRRILEVRRKCSYVPQDFMKPPTESLTAMDVIKLGLIFGEDGFERVTELAKELKATDLLEKPFGKLSGGQQQKIIIIRALARNPEVLLMDEPFSSLDAESKRTLCDILEGFRDRLVILVSHDEAIDKFVDGVIRMEGGEIVDIS